MTLGGRYGLSLALVCSILALLVSACASSAPASPPTAAPISSPPDTPTSAAFTDPFAYCASVDTIDTPDAHYVGTPVPDEIINGFKQAAGLTSSTEPLDQLRKSTIWRCMNGKVYACNFGANLPCDSKADTSQTPAAPLNEFCSANPRSDFIPLAVAGHNGIYSWRCVNGQAQIEQQIDQPDAQGYLSRIWYALTPGP